MSALRRMRIHLGAFDFTLWAVVGEDHAAVLRFVAAKLEDETLVGGSFDGCRGRVFLRDGYTPVLWIPRRPRTPREHATLAHEALHVTTVVMRWAGIPFGPDSEEAYAHVMAAIVAAVLERI